MAFTNGHPKVGGRRKGVPNRTTQEARDIARKILLEDPAYLPYLRHRVRTGHAPAMEALLWHHLFGRPQPAPDDATNALQLKETLEQLWRQHEAAASGSERRGEAAASASGDA
jgi:hypothetical protein